MLTSRAWERLVTGVWAELANEHGIIADVPEPGTRADVALSGPGMARTIVEVKRLARPLQPSAVRRLAEQAERSSADAPVHLLLIAPAASPQARAAAEETGASLLVAREGAPVEGFLRAGDGTTIHLAATEHDSAPPLARGRVPWGTYSVVFALLEAPAPDQHALAARAGVGRARVSQILSSLGGLAERSATGWAPTDSRALAGWLADHYPRRPLLATTWASLDPPVTAAEAISAHLDGLGIEHAVSGDVAADRLAPWARPTSAWLWCAAPVDLQPAGLTPAPADAAGVTLAVSEDPYLLPSAHRAGADLPMLPAWRVWVDLVHQDHQAAADALADAIVEGKAQ